MKIANEEIARKFEQIADLLEIEGANSFRVCAYRNAARSISSFTCARYRLYHEPLPSIMAKTVEGFVLKKGVLLGNMAIHFSASMAYPTASLELNISLWVRLVDVKHYLINAALNFIVFL